VAIAFGVGIIGGIYGIGGGSLLSPILVGRGHPIATVAPATLVSTFITSAAGAITYVILAITTHRTAHRTELDYRTHRWRWRPRRRLPRQHGSDHIYRNAHSEWA